ncbi:alpha-mannosidase, partial [bacterium]|nr:alpha-mannosidase [bacterium]
MANLVDRIRTRVDELHGSYTSRNEALNGWQMRHAKHLAPEQYEYLDDWAPLNVNEIWAHQGQTAFLRRTINVPGDWAGLRVGLDIKTGGEGLLSINGKPYHGVDDNRSYILLTPCAKGGETYECEIEIKTGNMFEFVVCDPTYPYILSRAHLLGIERGIEEVWLDFQVVYESAASEPDAILKEAMLQAMNYAIQSVDMRDKKTPAFKEQVAAARKVLWQKLGEINFGDCPGKGHFAGHSHIDVAWLWPLKETARKVGRTYSTVTTLMDEFPDYHFVCSQVPLFLYLKQYFPSLYEKVKARVAEGRFEPIGGTWVENDCNVVSGESMVRQCLYGQRFFRNELGANVRVGWLPDVFGYSWAMPQIYKKSGLDYFMTTKISWNDTNRLPNDTFWWQGVDGTRIFSHLVQGTYNHSATPGETRAQWNAYNSKLSCPDFIVSYGFGDGGGGPTREMLEYIPRMADIPGMPKASTGRTHAFFDKIAASTSDLPVWNGELYFELHRGTYTSQGRNKRANRISELYFRDAEMLSAIGTLFGLDYPKKELVEGWQTILLNQFHDIIPGSSIPDVYVDSQKQYAEIIANASEIKKNGIKAVAGRANTSGDGAPVVVFNSLSWDRTDVVEVKVSGLSGDCKAVGPDGSTVPAYVSDGVAVFAATVPSCGLAVYHISKADAAGDAAFKVDGQKISTPYYEAVLSADGTLTRLFDKAQQREVLPEGARANVLQIFEDKPTNWDAWDVELQYQDKVWEFQAKAAPKVLESSPARLVLGVNYTYGDSSLDQKIIFYADTPRVDFVNHVDWQERQTLLKVAFPVDVLSTKATYEIAFGAIERPTHWNTSWDVARFEVSGHRWADLSESGYGVSVLNDCKYGWDIKDNVIRLSLLRSPTNPDPLADKGEHDFTYSLYPHAGSWQDGTVQAAQGLNAPLQAITTDAHTGELGSTHSFVSVDKP